MSVVADQLVTVRGDWYEMPQTALRANIAPSATLAPPSVAEVTADDSPGPDPDQVLDVALEALRFEHAHAEAKEKKDA